MQLYLCSLFFLIALTLRLHFSSKITWSPQSELGKESCFELKYQLDSSMTWLHSAMLLLSHFIALYPLPEGSSSKSLCPGCDGSLRMFWAFLRHLALCSSSGEESSQWSSWQCWWRSGVLSSLLLCSWHTTHTHAVCQHTLYWAAVELQAVFVTDSFWGVSESKVSAVPSWWSLRCWHSTTGLPQTGCPWTWSQTPSPHNPRWCTVVGSISSFILVVLRTRLLSLHHPVSCSTSAL